MSNQSAGKKRLKDLLLQRDNKECADCSAPDPKWASANIGVFLCLKCCGVHRSLGPEISQVLSVTLDDWTDDEIEGMVQAGGNASVNSIYEANLPEGVSKPKRDASHEERSKYIKSKYELQEFMKPGTRIQSNSRGKHSLQQTSSNSKDLESIVLSAGGTFTEANLKDYIGMLKIRVIKGTNLAVRDMLSSDPYVILTLGQLKVQTTVVSSNLNPVWNEELKLAVPENFSPIKLEVYDHDTFSYDDIMGEAEIDIQPIVTSAIACGDAAMYGDRQIGKWFKSSDNALIEDSPVSIVDGKVKQDLWLRLQNVETGELEMELEWIPLVY